jgi:hypothetical protein
MGRQRQQTRLFLGESLRYCAVIASGPRAAMRFPITPLKSLAVEIFQRGEWAGCEEGFAYVPDDPLDPPFLISGAHLAGASWKVVVGAELEDPGIKVNGVAAPLEHHAA